MQTYESVIVVHPRLSDDQVEKFSKNIKESISKAGGEVLSEDKWGRRKLAYPIKKSREGFYLYYKYKAQGAFVNKMSADFRINEEVLRNLTVLAEVRKSSVPKPKAPKPKAAATS